MNAPLPADLSPDTATDAVRADAYRVLARLFAAPPDATLLAALAAAPRAADTTLGRAWNDLCDAAAALPEHATARLEGEFNDLFCGVGQARVMRYGSWYLSGALMDTPLAELRTDLAALGFARDADVREPEDHIAALCEVMAMLVAAGQPGQVGFYTRHLGSWYRDLCRRLADEATPFYGWVAQFARAFLDAETELLAP